MNKNETKSSYRQIMKATSIFGGVQVFNIIISIGRSKILAILLGPAGIGVLGLLMSTTKLISSLTNFGLGISAVKEIAAAFELNDEDKLAKILGVVRRWIWYTGLLGAIVTLCLAPVLSTITFGNNSYTIAFVWLAITLLLNQLASGNFVQLQGLRKLKHLAQANVIGAALGLLVSVPIYYYFGVKGIVPAMICTSLISFLAGFYFVKKISVKKTRVGFKETKAKGKKMLQMGFMLSLSGMMILGVAWVIRAFISSTGGVEEVGLFNAGIAIISTYVGLLFTAMETDYFPRLSAAIKDNEKAILLINQQTELALLILAPVLCAFIVYMDLIITLLYSTKFIPVKEMIYWAALGMFFRVTAWVVGFFFIAKGASKYYFWNELSSNIYTLILNVAGYYYYGLTGLGISYLISYFLYATQVYIVTRTKYQFQFNTKLGYIFLLQISLGSLCLVLVKTLNATWSYSMGSLVILISFYYSLIELDKRLNLKAFLSKYFKK